MDGSKARRRGSYLVFGEIGHDLHGRDHRVTLDVVLLELGLGADVRDDLRGMGGKEESQYARGQPVIRTPGRGARRHRERTSHGSSSKRACLPNSLRVFAYM